MTPELRASTPTGCLCPGAPQNNLRILVHWAGGSPVQVLPGAQRPEKQRSLSPACAGSGASSRARLPGPPGTFASPGHSPPAISCFFSPPTACGAGTGDLSRQRTKVVGERSQEPFLLWGRALQFCPFEISNSSLWTKS